MDENDKETRQKTMAGQKRQLDKILFELKQMINKTSKDVLARLKKIEQKKGELESAITL